MQDCFSRIHASSWLAAALLAFAVLCPTWASAQESGILEVKANVDSAEVYVDGELLGLTPFLEIVDAGSHDVRVVRDGFESYQQRVRVPPDTTITLTARLSRIAPALEVRVDVDTARVFLDDKQVGTGARVVVDPAEPGRHRLVVEAKDFGRWTGEVELLRGRVTPIQVALRGSLGSIVVHSDPEGAQVFLDGKDYGPSPTTIEPLPPGPHALELRHPERPRALRLVELPAGKKMTVDTALEAEGGTLVIRPNPSNAELWVNALALGAGRQDLGSVQPGSYAIRASAEGHLDFVTTVEVVAGKKTSVNARLESLSSGRQTSRLVGPAPSSVGARGAASVLKHPGFWAGVGGGVGAVVAVVVVAAAASNASSEPSPSGPQQPSADLSFALP